MDAKLNKIEANDRTVRNLLDKSKYTIDIFQREYKWEKKHVEQLLSDLESRFYANYDPNHERKQVANYSRYFLGSIVLSQKGAVRFIIDGQQRLTSLTLLLIYLNNLQRGREEEETVHISDLIFSQDYGERSFNLQIEERKDCMEALYTGGTYDSRSKSDSVKNIVERYNDIAKVFPSELSGKALPFFIDWLTKNVILVEILTYSDEDAYTIFETMNDRGLSLTATELLKGYLLSNISEEKEKAELNSLWKSNIQRLNEIDPKTDDAFFTDWFRAKFAETTRQRKKDSENQDFEKIGTRFHSWVRDNKEKMRLKMSKDVYNLVKSDFNFFVGFYETLSKAEANPIPGLENVYYVGKRGFAFMYPLAMAPIRTTDDDETIAKKVALVSRYIETYFVCRSINGKTLGYDSIRYTMFNLMKEIRDKNTAELAKILKAKVIKADEKLTALADFELLDYYKWFTHFLLARITGYIEEKSSKPNNFEQYISTGAYAPCEIEHIIGDDFQTFGKSGGFNDENEFKQFRNKIGNLILLPNGFNQSYGKDPFSKKLPRYFGQNLLAQTLNNLCYVNNPNFIKYKDSSKLPFKPYTQFGKQEIIERTTLYQKICEEIWSPEGFDTIANG